MPCSDEFSKLPRSSPTRTLFVWTDMTPILLSFVFALFPVQETTVPVPPAQPASQTGRLQPALPQPTYSILEPIEQPKQVPAGVTKKLTGQTLETQSPPSRAMQTAGQQQPVPVQPQPNAQLQSAAQPQSAQSQSDQPAARQFDTLVVCPQDFLESLRPWVDYRQQQGHRILVHAPPVSSYEIKQLVKRVAAEGTLKSVLLIGDSGDANGNAARMVPTDFIKSEVTVEFGSEAEIATDNTYADIDEDGVPDVAIGRLPVDTPAELSAMIQRIILYETPDHAGEWERRVNLVAGVGGFGELVDRLIEQTTRQIVTDLIPAEYNTSMTYGSWTSPYCPDPRRFSETAIGRFNEGCMFWVYIGHAARHRLDKIYMPDQCHEILDQQTVTSLRCEAGNPIAIFLACYTGATDDPEDCLAELMLRQEQGPIAVIAGTRVTMPYAMSVLSLELIREYFAGDVVTLGELMLVGKQRLVRGREVEPDSVANDSGENNGGDESHATSGDLYRTMIEGMGKAMSPMPELLEKERREHAHLIHLLGDPLLRLRRPGILPLSVPAEAKAGELVEISGEFPAAGTLRLDVCYRRDRFRHRPPRRKEYDSSEESFSTYQTAYDRAHELVCLQEDFTTTRGTFTHQIRLPEDASGECHVRAMLITENGTVMGSAPIKIKALSRSERTARKPDESVPAIGINEGG